MKDVQEKSSTEQMAPRSKLRQLLTPTNIVLLILLFLGGVYIGYISQ